MKARFARLAVILAFSAAGWGPTSFEKRPDMNREDELIKGDAGVAPYSTFGIDLYLKAVETDLRRNVFISPASVGLALAMAWNGSAGQTQEAMAAALRLPSSDLAVVNEADARLIDAMGARRKGVELNVANSLWARQGIDFKAAFLGTNTRFYRAEVRKIDFADSSSPGVINAWVAEKTKGKIREVVGSLDSLAILYLINAIYFKGTWRVEFDPKATRNWTFHGTAGEKIVKMMQRSGEFSYREGSDGQAVRLPYGDGRIGMYVFLPAEKSSLAEFHSHLTSKSWKRWLGEFAEREGILGLPRFKIEYETKLRKPLTALGMGVAFDGERADFSNMLITSPGKNAYIHDVIHKTYCEVNEEGTEAAAATGVEVRTLSYEKPPKRFVMICDRPFFFAIADEETGLILFLGSIVDPSIS
jgi:serine protease inhibitor